MGSGSAGKPPRLSGELCLAAALLGARSQLGYPSFMAAQPNSAHQALVRMKQAGQLCGLVTQNVDRLHQRAGHQNVVDLHGRLDQVICIDCRALVDRDDIQVWLDAKIPGLGPNPSVRHLTATPMC